MINTFTFDSVLSSTYGVFISGSGVYNAASRDITTLEIPGRDGVLTIDNGRFNMIKHEYPAFVKSTFKTNIQGLRNALMSKRGMKRLTDTYHTDEFYLAYFEDGLEVEPSKNLQAGELTITFMRDPRRFLTSGESATTFTADGTISNPTLFDARPLLRVYGTGQLGIGTDTITISAADVYTDIDCEMRECYKGTTSKNSNVTFTGEDFPVLKPGSNGIDLGTGITKVEVTPRWYRL
jgi:phage-related protein